MLLIACNPATPSKVGFDFQSFKTPGIQYRPWVRWWWPGNDVDAVELKREVDLLADNGFGGAEIQAFDAALNPNADAEVIKRRHSVDTQAFFDNLAIVMTQAKSRGLAIDLNLGSGWPPGGSQVTPKQSIQALVFSENRCTGPKTVHFEMKQPDKPVFYQIAAGLGDEGGQMATFMPDYASLIAVVAAKVTGGKRTTKMLDLTDQVVLDPDSMRILTDQVKDGVLSWACPAGNWAVIAFFSMPDGEPVGFDAQEKPGLVMDLFNADEVNRNLKYLLGERTGLQTFYGDPMRGLFVDSFELKTERFFTNAFLKAFLDLRGYDVTRFLPAVTLPGADNSIFDGIGAKELSAFSLGDVDRRIQYDYQRTASDLFISRFIETTTTWAHNRDLVFRVQPYGLNIDVIRAAGMADIPEAEQLYAGGTDAFIRLVASGAHLYGRNIVSAEALVWPMRDQATTPAVIKAAADKLFCDGVNHLIYHGFPYKKLKDYGRIGWHPFCSPFGGTSTYSSQINETSAFWPQQARVNEYVARCQYMLRQGKPHADLLVYYPYFGFPASFFRLDYWEELFNGRMYETDKVPGRTLMADLATAMFGPPDESGILGWLRSTGRILAELSAMGWDWDWLNDDAIMNADASAGYLEINGRKYKAVLVLDASAMPVRTAQKLAGLAQAGGAVLIAGSLPSTQPGFFDYKHGDTLVRQAIVQITALQSPLDMNPSAIAGRLGRITTPDIAFSPARPQLHHAQRDLGNDARLIFFANESGDEISTKVTFSSPCQNPLWMDPKTGVIKQASDDNRITLDLGDHGSVFLTCGLHVPDVGSDDANVTDTIEITGPWSVEYTAFDTGKQKTTQMDTLQPLNEIQETRYIDGTVVYKANIRMQPDPKKSYVLDLGRVLGTAKVLVNGRDAGELILPPFKVPLDAGLFKDGQNSIVIKVSLSLRNFLIGKAKSGDAQTAQFGGNSHDLMPTGLLGPVRIEVKD